MKKMLVFLLLVMAFGPKLAWADTETITPTRTTTFTFSPTITPTFTPGMIKDSTQMRVYLRPSDFINADGVTPLNATASLLVAYRAQSLSQSAVVLATATPGVRAQLVVPANYKGQKPPRIFIYANRTSGTNALNVQCRVAVQSFNKLTSTSRVYVGADTDISATIYWPLKASKMNRVNLPLSSSMVLHPGDLLNISIDRTGGTTGDLYIYALEFQYDWSYGRPF